MLLLAAWCCCVAHTRQEGGRSTARPRSLTRYSCGQVARRIAQGFDVGWAHHGNSRTKIQQPVSYLYHDKLFRGRETRGHTLDRREMRQGDGRRRQRRLLRVCVCVCVCAGDQKRRFPRRSRRRERNCQERKSMHHSCQNKENWHGKSICER